MDNGKAIRRGAMQGKILVVDDHEKIRTALRRLLQKEGYAVREAGNGPDALKMVGQDAPDVILLDLMMPGMDGLDVCRHIKRHLQTSHIYIIMLTVRSDVEDEIKGLDVGADDYMGKPYNPARLAARIRKGLEVSAANLNANFDPLMRIFNRRVFDVFLEKELGRTRRYERPLSLILMDIDYFKKINDTRGHDAGDRVLVELAALLRRECRDGDLLARWGGEEIALLMPETTLEGALKKAEKLRLQIEAHFIPEIGHITASFGVACTAAIKNKNVDLLKAADLALYEAKAGGRNKVIPYKED